MDVLSHLIGWLICNQLSTWLQASGQRGGFAVIASSAQICLKSGNILKFIDNFHRMGRVYARFAAQRPAGCSQLLRKSR